MPKLQIPRFLRRREPTPEQRAALQAERERKEAERQETKKFDGAFARRAPGKWLGNTRFWDLFNRYTSKQHIKKVKSLLNSYNALQKEYAKQQTTPARRTEIIESMEVTAKEYVKHVANVGVFKQTIEQQLATLRRELSGGEIEDRMAANRDILARLGRGSVTEKYNSLKKIHEEHSETAKKLQELLRKNHFDVLRETNQKALEAAENAKVSEPKK